MNKICGIYCIKNIKNEKRYIGKSINCSERLKQHRRDLKRNSHCNQYLQNSFNKHGEEFFTFEILKECFPDELDNLEIYYIQKFKTKFYDNGYNIENGGVGGNERIDISTREKISNSLRGIIGRRSKRNDFVGIREKDGKWESAITINGKQIYLGRFTSAEIAALAYDKASLEEFGKTYNFSSDYVRDTIIPEKTYSSQYIGVSQKWDNRRGNKFSGWYCRGEGENIIFRKTFKTEILAAQNHDIFSLMNHKNPKINFPELTDKYLYLINNNIFPIYEELRE